MKVSKIILKMRKKERKKKGKEQDILLGKRSMKESHLKKEKKKNHFERRGRAVLWVSLPSGVELQTIINDY